MPTSKVEAENQLGQGFSQETAAKLQSSWQWCCEAHEQSAHVLGQGAQIWLPSTPASSCLAVVVIQETLNIPKLQV